jgi:uncharacterized protein YeaC (DUF1315 family)
MQDRDIEVLIEQMDEAAVQRMRQAVETGRWPDGHTLPEDQRGLCMRAVLAWEARFLPEEERTGYIERPNRAAADDPERPVRFPDSEGDDDA